MQNNKWIHNDGKTRLCSQVKLLPVLSPGLLSFLDSWSVMHGQLGWCNDAMSTVQEAGSRNMMETHKTVIQSVGRVGVHVTWGLVKGKDMSRRGPEKALLGRDVLCSKRPPRGLAQGSPFRRGEGSTPGGGEPERRLTYLRAVTQRQEGRGDSESQSSKHSSSLGFRTTRLHLINDQQMLGALSQGMQSRQILNG